MSIIANSICVILALIAFTVNAQMTKEDKRAAAEHLLGKYISISIDPYRGLTKEEWDRRSDIFLGKVDSARNSNELYYSLRYFGALSNDGHFNFPDMGVYNRWKFFKKEDMIFPVIVKATQNDRVFVVHDYSNSIPNYAELLEINGIDAGEISRLQHILVPFEPNYAYAYLNEKEEFSFRAWVSFSNYLFCENISGPYTVKYSVDGVVKSATINAMERQSLHKMSRSLRSSSIPFFKKVMKYNRHNDSIAVLDINYFWGNNPLTFLFSYNDSRFERLLKKKMKRINRNDIKHLVIDIRSNPGGYSKNVYELMSYFAPDMVYDDKAILKISAEAQKDDRGARILESAIKMRHGKKGEEDNRIKTVELYKSIPEGSVFRTDTIMPMTYTHEKSKHVYNNNVYVLANSTSFSASTMFCNYFRKSGVGLIAGTPPAGYSKITGGARIPFKYWLTFTVPMKIPHILSNPLDEDAYHYIMPDIPIENELHDWVRGEDKSLDILIEMIEFGKLPEKQ